jgi:hypothetical protein
MVGVEGRSAGSPSSRRHLALMPAAQHCLRWPTRADLCVHAAGELLAPRKRQVVDVAPPVMMTTEP